MLSKVRAEAADGATTSEKLIFPVAAVLALVALLEIAFVLLGSE